MTQQFRSCVATLKTAITAIVPINRCLFFQFLISGHLTLFCPSTYLDPLTDSEKACQLEEAVDQINGNQSI